jgi:hypothetical protein
MLSVINKALGRWPHPTEEELIAYRSVGLDDKRRKTVQSHLSECDRCRETIKDIDDFFEPARVTEEPVGADKIGQEWESLSRRIRAEANLGAQAPSGKWFFLPALRFQPIYGVAAVLICVTLSLGLYALSLQRETQRLSRVMQSEREESAERSRALEIENQQLKEEAGRQKNDDGDIRRMRNDYEARISELKQPRLNSPIFDIYPKQLILRSPGKPEVNRISIPAHAESFVLIINGEDQPEASSYEVEILAGKGRSVWRKRGLRRESDRNFVIMIPRTFLNSGEYSLKIRSRDGARSKGEVEYLISITM